MGDGLAGAVRRQLLPGGADPGDKLGVVRQVAAKYFLQPEQRIDALLLIALRHPLLDLVDQRIAHVDRLTRVVRTTDVAHPAGNAEGQRTDTMMILYTPPSGESALIDLTLAEGADPVATLQDLKHITDQLLVRNPAYRCTRCGFPWTWRDCGI